MAHNFNDGKGRDTKSENRNPIWFGYTVTEMTEKKKTHPKEKTRLHPRSRHRQRYDLKQLSESFPELKPFVKLNAYKDESIDFADLMSVKMLNRALLKHHYGIDNWDVPTGYLCPPIPGRADYIHHIADLLCESNYGKIPKGKNVVCLDIGVGANCIYPILGNIEYGWSFIGSDIDPIALKNATQIVELNPLLKEHIELRLQANRKDVLYGILSKEEYVDLVICNPPFHASAAEALAGTLRKLNNLNTQKQAKPTKNFGGVNSELWCDGGERRFVRNLVHESKKFSDHCYWFSTLISKQTNLKALYGALTSAKAEEVITLPMGQGNKTSRIVAWTFLTPNQQKNWRDSRWN